MKTLVALIAFGLVTGLAPAASAGCHAGNVNFFPGLPLPGYYLRRAGNRRDPRLVSRGSDHQRRLDGQAAVHGTTLICRRAAGSSTHGTTAPELGSRSAERAVEELLVPEPVP